MKKIFVLWNNIINFKIKVLKLIKKKQKTLLKSIRGEFRPVSMLNYKLDYCWVVFFKTEYHTFYFATLFNINKRKSITCAPGISSAFNIKDPFPFSSSMVPKEIFIKSFA